MAACVTNASARSLQRWSRSMSLSICTQSGKHRDANTAGAIWMRSTTKRNAVRVTSGCLRKSIWRLATVQAIVKQECVFSDDDPEKAGKAPRGESPTLCGSCAEEWIRTDGVHIIRMESDPEGKRRATGVALGKRFAVCGHAWSILRAGQSHSRQRAKGSSMPACHHEQR